MFKDGLDDYFSDLWNYLDLIPILLMDLTLVLDWLEYFPEVQRPLLAICSLMLWFKFMYYLRIFRKTSFFISMIIAVFRDIIYFIFILIIVCVAFGSSFYIISNQNRSDDPEQDLHFIDSYILGIFYAYQIALGDFATDEFGQFNLWLVWILFLLSTLFVVIIMFNLLVAIVGDTFERVLSHCENSMYMEIASLMVDNEHLISGKDAEKYNQENGKYLIVVKPDLEDSGDDQWEGRMAAIKKTIQKVDQEVSAVIEDRNKVIADNLLQKVNHLSGQQDKLEDRLRSILKS